MRKTIGTFLVLSCYAWAMAAADPAKLISPLDRVETLSGDVQVSRSGQAVTVTVRGQQTAGDRLFLVEADDLGDLPASFHSDWAQIRYWRGHLVVTAPREGKAFHFSISGFGEPVRPSPEADVTGLGDRLRERFELTRIDSATAITARSGPRAFVVEEEKGLRKMFEPDDNQEVPGGGVGNCGTSCTITCGDGSTCSTSCGSRRCASCSCPASCSCA